MVDIFDEVSEDLRADWARGMLLRYGGLLIGACLLVLVGVAGWQWNQARTDKEDQRVASLFIAATTQAAAATDNATRASAIAAFQNVETQGHHAYTALARLNEADLRYGGGDVKQALALWDQVANDTSAPNNIRDLAVIFWVQHQLDKGDPSVLAGRLSPLLNPSNVWHGLASEQMALLELRQGQTAKARDRLQALENDASAPQGARERAVALLSSIGG